MCLDWKSFLPLTKEGVLLGLESELENVKSISDRARSSYEAKDTDEALEVCRLIHREGGIEWRLMNALKLIREMWK